MAIRGICSGIHSVAERFCLLVDNNALEIKS